MPLLTVAQAAAAYNYSEATIRRYFPTIRVGRAVRIDSDDAEAYLASRRTGGPHNEEPTCENENRKDCISGQTPPIGGRAGTTGAARRLAARLGLG